MAAADTLRIKLSQDSLFFPLPFTNATIDNVVQMKNPLPAVQGDPKANAVAFKILSEVQYRYSVRPSVGVIAPGEHATVVFSFNPESVKTGTTAKERELPTEATQDAIHVDFAVIDAAAVATALVNWAPDSKEAKASRAVMADVSQFWKQRGQVKKNTPTTLRVKLRCIFANRSHVPESLVICMKEEGSAGKEKGNVAASVQKGAAAPVAETAAASPPKTRPPSTTSTTPHNTAPPESPPHHHAVGTRITGTPPRTNGKGSAAPSGVVATPSPTLTARRVAMASASQPPASPPSPKKALKSGGSSGSEGASEFMTRVLNYRLSYEVVVLLLLLTLLCGLLDQSNIVTWMIARN